MDFEAIETKMREAREFDVKIVEATYRLRIPTPGEYRLLAGPFNENGRIPDKNLASFERALAARALVGWRGVSLKDIDGSGTGAFPYTEDAVKLLLSYRVDIQDRLVSELIAEKAKRQKALEDDRKNLQSGSPGKETSSRRAA